MAKNFQCFQNIPFSVPNFDKLFWHDSFWLQNFRMFFLKQQTLILRKNVDNNSKLNFLSIHCVCLRILMSLKNKQKGRDLLKFLSFFKTSVIQKTHFFYKLLFSLTVRTSFYFNEKKSFYLLFPFPDIRNCVVWPIDAD